MAALSWPTILARAAEIVNSYGQRITLRQLFYRLVVDPSVKLPNNLNSYNRLGRLTAAERRAGTFPRLIDNGRAVNCPLSFTDPTDALDWLTGDGAWNDYAPMYRVDRQLDQEYAIYLGLEKHTLEGLVETWFRPLGLPIIALGGMSGEELVTDVAEELTGEERKSVLLYVGDFDPSGFQIPANFCERLWAYGVEFDHIGRVALNHDDVGTLPHSIQPVKVDDPNYGRFRFMCEGWGVEPVQIEAEALDPNVLRARIQAEVDTWWDTGAYQARLDEEADHIGQLRDAEL